MLQVSWATFSSLSSRRNKICLLPVSVNGVRQFARVTAIGKSAQVSIQPLCGKKKLNYLKAPLQLTTDIYQRIAAAKVFIDENYHEPIDLDQISRQAFLSRFHFHRLFTRIYKRTPLQYVTQTRLEAAKLLLAKEGISIMDVCNSIGFESHGSFSSLFSRQNGYSPQYYRNIAWLKKKLAKEQPKRFIPHCFIDQYRLDDSPAPAHQ